MTKKNAPRHRGHDAKGAGGVVFGDRRHLTQNQAGSKSPRHRVAQGDRIEVFAGPGQRLVPAPILNMLRKKFPRLIGAVIENGNDVYLLIANKKGRLREDNDREAAAERPRLSEADVLRQAKTLVRREQTRGLRAFARRRE